MSLPGDRREAPQRSSLQACCVSTAPNQDAPFARPDTHLMARSTVGSGIRSDPSARHRLPAGGSGLRRTRTCWCRCTRGQRFLVFQGIGVGVDGRIVAVHPDVQMVLTIVDCLTSGFVHAGSGNGKYDCEDAAAANAERPTAACTLAAARPPGASTIMIDAADPTHVAQDPREYRATRLKSNLPRKQTEKPSRYADSTQQGTSRCPRTTSDAEARTTSRPRSSGDHWHGLLTNRRVIPTHTDTYPTRRDLWT